MWPSTLCEEGRQVFGSYQLWNQAPLPPFVCLPPGLNSIDQRLAGLLLQPGSEAAKKPWLASTTNRQYLFLITQLYFSRPDSHYSVCGVAKSALRVLRYLGVLSVQCICISLAYKFGVSAVSPFSRN